MIKILLFHFHHKKLGLHRLSVLIFSRFSAFRKFLSLFFHLNILYVPTFWVIETLITICSNLFLNKSLQLRKYNTLTLLFEELKVWYPNAMPCFSGKNNLNLFFLSGFLSRPFTNHRTAGEGDGHFFNSSLPLPPASLEISLAITADNSPLHIGSSRTRTGNL